MSEESSMRRGSSLHKLVQSTFIAHRRDIHDYAAGHLNYSKLRSPAKILESKWRKKELFWESSAARDQNAERGSTYDYDEERYETMRNALLDFSSGTTAAIPLLNARVTLPSPTFSNQDVGELQRDENLEKTLLEEMEKLINEKGPAFFQLTSKDLFPHLQTNDKKFDKKSFPITKNISPKVYAEELKLPELMLRSTNDSALFPPSMQPARSDILKKSERQNFVTTHLAGVTRKDQFQKLLDFKTNVLKYSDTLEQNVRDGHQAVEHLEHKLVGRLIQLQSQGQAAGPSFERLQVYAEIWNDLALDSSMFGDLLREIKHEYDDHLAHLLDSMKSSDRGELARSLHLIDDMSSQKSAVRSENLRTEVEELETLCEDALLRNYEMRQEIEKEQARIEEEQRIQREEEEENMRRMLPIRRSQHKVSSKTVQVQSAGPSKKTLSTEKRLKKLRVEIWERLDKLTEEKKSLRTSFVPKPVLRNLQHSLKDVELEMQRLNQQNDYLAQIRTDCQTQLAMHFERNGMNEVTKQMIWSELGAGLDDPDSPGNIARSDFLQKMLNDEPPE